MKDLKEWLEEQDVVRVSAIKNGEANKFILTI